MTAGEPPAVARDVRTLFGAGAIGGLTDGQLLERFVSRRDASAEAAFAVLVERHGAMVWGVCRRILRDPHATADAFQATFLVLVRRAAAVRVDDSLGRWLYGVSRRVAARARSAADRRSALEGRGVEGVVDPAPDPDPGRAELLEALDEEVARLPERYRAAVVLCDLSGLSHEEAARRLDCAVGTVGSRLARGRERLRSRLVRRGLAPSAGLLALSSIEAEGATAPAGLVEATVRAAIQHAAGPGAAVGAASASAITLAEGVIKTMVTTKLKLAMAALLAAGVVAGGAVGPSLRASGGAAEGPQEKAAPAGGEPRKDPPAGPSARRDAEPERPPDDPDLLKAEIAIKEGLLLKAKAEQELAGAIIATNLRLNARRPGMVSQEEVHKNEAAVKVAAAEVEIIRAQIRALQLRLDRAELRRREDPGASAAPSAALERRLRAVEAKLDRVLEVLESIKGERSSRPRG